MRTEEVYNIFYKYQICIEKWLLSKKEVEIALVVIPLFLGLIVEDNVATIRLAYCKRLLTWPT